MLLNKEAALFEMTKIQQRPMAVEQLRSISDMNGKHFALNHSNLPLLFPGTLRVLSNKEAMQYSLLI